MPRRSSTWRPIRALVYRSATPQTGGLAGIQAALQVHPFLARCGAQLGAQGPETEGFPGVLDQTPYAKIPPGSARLRARTELLEL